MRDGRIRSICVATRYGNVSVTAAGFVDASGDAALTWQAGLPCWVPERPIYGSQQVIVENVDESRKPDAGEMDARIAEKAEEYGLLRRGGRALFFPRPGAPGLDAAPHPGPPGPPPASPAHPSA